MNSIIIEVQDFNNNWFMAKSIQAANDQVIRREMEQTAQNMRGRRVRAVDQNGRLIDLLG
jgi:hypothetical protein